MEALILEKTRAEAVEDRADPVQEDSVLPKEMGGAGGQRAEAALEEEEEEEVRGSNGK